PPPGSADNEAPRKARRARRKHEYHRKRKATLARAREAPTRDRPARRNRQTNAAAGHSTGRQTSNTGQGKAGGQRTRPKEREEKGRREQRRRERDALGATGGSTTPAAVTNDSRDVAPSGSQSNSALRFQHFINEK